ncbi:putative forkhead-associated (FHA) domain, SMAD/FHA domain superfamily [Plasmopara halstedii]
MPSTSPFKTVLRVCQSIENNQQTQEHETHSLSHVASNGIVLGTGSHATYKLRPGSEADALHGTLERTSGLGVWVYSDHSSEGTIVNNVHKILHDAVVVHQGDTLTLGQIEIKLCLEKNPTEVAPEEEESMEQKERVSPVSINQKIETSTSRAERLARRRASTPWGSTSFCKTLSTKQQLHIQTSGLSFVESQSIATIEPIVIPEYTASNGCGTQWQEKQNSIAMTTLKAGSPKQPRQSQSSHRSRTQFVLGIDVPQVEENTEKVACPPPLEYSSSPIVSPSSLMTRKRHTLVPSNSDYVNEMPPPPFLRVTARRDDLRIQVSKKMAAAAPMSAGKLAVPCVIAKNLEVQAPASPVAQRDIKKQQETLQTILKQKSNEEQLLKQQQEEWMRMAFESCDSPDTMSGEREKQSCVNIDSDELAFFSVQTPVLLRTISLGMSEQQTPLPSPRSSASTRASRSRLNSCDGTFIERKRQDSNGRRKTTALVLSPSLLYQNGVELSPSVKENELRTSNDSISSSATTITACHRRVTSSLVSDPASSVDLCDFVGYEEDTEDLITSYTTAELYGSDEHLRHSREDCISLLDTNRIDRFGTLSPPLSSISYGLSPLNSADTRLGSPRRCSLKTSENSISNNINESQHISDSTETNNVRPRDDQYDSHSSHESTAFLKSCSQFELRRPIQEGGDDDNKEGMILRQSRPQSFRRRASFRHHVSKPLTGTNKT